MNKYKFVNKFINNKYVLIMTEVGISSIVGYIPKLRLLRKSVAESNAWLAPNLVGKGKGTRSMANWDEDSVTMSVEAARRLLGPEDDRSHVDNVFLASTTLPFADRLNSGIVRAALTLEESTQCTDISVSYTHLTLPTSDLV